MDPGIPGRARAGRPLTDWVPARQPPERAGYYLVTCAPGTWADVTLKDTQDYCEQFSSLAWFNPDSGPWWLPRPGHGRFENTSHVVTHWAPRPTGARPTLEQLQALPQRKWLPWWGPDLEQIAKALVFGRKEEAFRLIREQLIPRLTEKDKD